MPDLSKYVVVATSAAASGTAGMRAGGRMLSRLRAQSDRDVQVSRATRGQQAEGLGRTRGPDAQVLAGSVESKCTESRATGGKQARWSVVQA